MNPRRRRQTRILKGNKTDMAKNLVIIESPPKAHTIQACLGSNYKVVASKGHVRDLPKSTFGIDIENNFEPHYINIRGKGDLIKELKKEAKDANRVFLATDPDREGEAISWHLATALGLPPEKTQRVTFNEITKTAVKTAIKAPRQIDMNLVNAQQSRRILDRIVGYKLSPLLWNLRRGLSAGRVQSVATRLVVDREEEIRAFVPTEYWTIEARLAHASGAELSVRYFAEESDTEKRKLECAADAEKIVADVAGKNMTVKSVRHGVKYKSPAPPFTTSTMLQEASKRLGFQAARIMRTAQELYEGINLGTANGGAQGLITYMRTDSLRVAQEAQDAAREFIAEKYGEQYRPAQPRVYKTKASAQDAHEAIRPARISLTPADVKAYLTPDQFKLYRLIWERFTASQMENARLDTLSVDFAAAGHLFRTSGYTVAFQGYMAVYEESRDDSRAEDDEDVKNLRVPALNEGEALSVSEVTPAKHFTEAPARYTEATLIKALEDKGIGRPSTIPPTITTIMSREYVRREGKSILPTELGEVITKMMQNDFADIVDYKFTARMEDMLDEVAGGETTMTEVLNEFWTGFSAELEKAEEKQKNERTELPVEETDIVCEKCGAKMIIKTGRFGKFAACPNYPACRNTKPLTEREEKPGAELKKADFKCELCGGDMVLRTGPYGPFYACANYPQCKFIKREEKKVGVPCPKCGGDILVRHGRKKNSIFYSCANYPTCDFSSWDLPTTEVCPDCGAMLFRKKGANGGLICHDKECGYFRAEPDEARQPSGAELPPMPGDDDVPPEN